MRPRIFDRTHDSTEFSGMGASGAFLEKLCDGARHCNHDGDCLLGAVAAMNEASASVVTRFRESSGEGAEVALAVFAWMLELQGSTSLQFVESALQSVCGGCFHRGACREAIGWGWMVENALKNALDSDAGNKVEFNADADEHGPYLLVTLVPQRGRVSWFRYHADAETVAATRSMIDPQRILDILEPICLNVAGRIGGRASHKALHHATIARTRDLKPWDVLYNALADLAAREA